MPSINYRISLEGGQQVKQELLSIEVAIKRLQAAAKTSVGADTFASTTAAISTLGSTAKEALGAAAAAAQKFAASSSELARVEGIINALGARARLSGTTFATLAQNYDRARASVGGVGQAAAQVGAGLGRAGEAAARTAEATRGLNTALGLTRTQFGMLGQALTVAGLGGLGATASSLGAMTIGFGALAASIAGLVVAGAGLTKFALDAAKVAAGLSRLSDVSGVAFSELSELQSAFQLGGVSAEQFSQQFTKLVADYLNGSQQLERANLAVKESHLALAQAQQQGLQIAQQFAELELQAAQRAQQGQELALQTQQLAEQERSLQAQLATLSQINALERQRADLAERDATAQLALLDLENQFSNNQISEIAFTERKKSLTDEERKRQRETLVAQKEEAELRKRMLQEEQEQRRQQMEMQQQQFEMQKQALELQKQQQQQQAESAGNQRKQLELQQQANKLAIDKAKLDEVAAEKAQKYAELQDKAAQAVLKGNEGMADLADLFKGLSAGEALELGKKLGFDQKTIDLLRKGGDAIRANEKLIKDLGLGLDKADKDNLKAFGEGWDRMTGIAGAALTKLGAKFAGVINDISKGKNVLGPIASALGNSFMTGFIAPIVEVAGIIGRVIAQGIGVAFEFVLQLASQAAQGIVSVWNRVVQFFIRLGQMIRNALGMIWQFITQQASQAAQMVMSVWNAVIEFFSNIGQQIGSAFGAAWDLIVSGAGAVAQLVIDAWNGVLDFFTGLGNSIAQAFTTAMAKITDIVVGAITTIISWINKAIEALRQLGGASSGGASAPAAAPAPEPAPFARGGLFGGRGTGTSDSNLAWVSRGEHIMPARAVRQPGVLAFLEALRRSGGDLTRILDGMGRFALGGMVGHPMAIPAFASGGLANGRNLGTLTLALPDGSLVSGLTDAKIADALRRTAGLGQVRSGGRKPSRYA